MNPGYDCPEPEDKPQGVREMMIASYELPRFMYSRGIRSGRKSGSPVAWATEFGCYIWYALKHPGRRKKTPVDVDKLAMTWKKAVVGLATAHSKDEADSFEANIENCLSPILTAPVSQIRELGAKIAELLKADPAVPYLVWRAYEVWYDQMKLAPDDGIKELKRDLAAQIVELVEKDAKEQLPEAMIRALMWRAPSKLEEVKAVVEKEKAAGRGVRLRGRESCLFLEAGGTEDDPLVCVQV